MRAPFQILALPFRRGQDTTEFAVLRRSDAGWWQFVAGGGEGSETPAQAASREIMEEIGFESAGKLIKLDCMAYIRKSGFGSAAQWDPSLYVIPEYHFAVELSDFEIVLSREHTEVRWLGYQDAHDILHWDSNKTGLWELAERIKHDTSGEAPLETISEAHQ